MSRKSGLNSSLGKDSYSAVTLSKSTEIRSLTEIKRSGDEMDHSVYVALASDSITAAEKALDCGCCCHLCDYGSRRHSDDGDGNDDDVNIWQHWHCLVPIVTGCGSLARSAVGTTRYEASYVVESHYHLPASHFS